MSDRLSNHLKTGATTVARAWSVTRHDGVRLGFTDHDRGLQFDGIDFVADAGLTARAFEQSTGLAVDNTEATGLLSSDAITEADIVAGRYDGAEVCVWLINWRDVTERRIIFRGHIGEVTRVGQAFSAELRGLTEPLNREQGRVYHPRCSAVLGDRQCRADLSQPGMCAEAVVASVDGPELTVEGLGGFDDAWFAGGWLVVHDGEATGLSGLIRSDRRQADGSHRLQLWHALGARLAPGDAFRIEPGCDRTSETCHLKFNNFMNFRGFPHIPGEDWLMASPASAPQRSRASIAGTLT